MPTSSKGGRGSNLQKMESVQVTMRSMESSAFSLSCDSRGPSALWLRTKSRHSEDSEAVFPRARTACSMTTSFVSLSIMCN